jgi:starch phosphorylase
MESYVWPELPPQENPLGYVTNGVHLFTFLSSRWRSLFDLNFGGNWRNRILDADYWTVVDEIPDYAFWSTRQSLKQDMLEYVRRHVCRQFRKQGLNPVQIEHLAQLLDPKHPDVLVLGFARRFATYKRADLLFQDPERMQRLLNDPQRPVLLLVAGKAHPADDQGQALLRRIHEISLQPQFQGHVLLLEDYNLALARWLVTGVDVWLNTPEYPLEACGTSGQKAAVNGVLNLSVLDGWWPEAYDGTNGWAIQPAVAVEDPAERRRIEAEALLDLLEEQVIPLYFNRDGEGYSKGWVRRSKASMRTVIPRFNAGRMLRDYVLDYYRPARDAGRRLGADDAAGARALAEWKARVRTLWPGVRLRRVDEAPKFVAAGEAVHVRMEVELGGLRPDDLLVECLVGYPGETGDCPARVTYRLRPEPWDGGQTALFTLEFVPELPGLVCYRFRAYPHHPELSHPLEMGRMRWA